MAGALVPNLPNIHGNAFPWPKVPGSRRSAHRTMRRGGYQYLVTAANAVYLAVDLRVLTIDGIRFFSEGTWSARPVVADRCFITMSPELGYPFSRSWQREDRSQGPASLTFRSNARARRQAGMRGYGMEGPGHSHKVATLRRPSEGWARLVAE